MVAIFYQFSTSDLHSYASHGHSPARWNLAVYGTHASISFLCGAFILRGANWARWLFTIAWAFFLALTVAVVVTTKRDISQLALIVLIEGPMLFFLFGRRANHFFTSEY